MSDEKVMTEQGEPVSVEAAEGFTVTSSDVRRTTEGVRINGLRVQRLDR